MGYEIDCKHGYKCEDIECNCDCHYNVSELLDSLEKSK